MRRHQKPTITKTVAACILTVMSAAVAFPASAAQSPPLYLNGKLLNLSSPPLVVQNRTLVPLRGYMEALGADVYWQPPDTVSVQWEDRTITLRIGAKSAQVGGNSVALDVPAQLINSQTFVPLRFLSEGLGATVAWDGKAVSVTSPVGSLLVSDGPLNVRSGPNLSAPVLLTVPIGTRFSILSTGPDWTQVALPRDRTGWVATGYTQPLPHRSPFDPFADTVTNSHDYLQVQGTCLGKAPIWNGQLYAPLAPTVTALGGTVNDTAQGATVQALGYTWQVPQSLLVRVADQSFVAVRTLAGQLGLSVNWDSGRNTALLDAPGANYPTARTCNLASAAPAYLIMDARSGLVLSEQQADQTRPIASITKIMTGLLAVERLTPDTVITASKNAASQIGTSMYLRAGDRVRLGDMLYGLLLPSGNDAAVAIAEQVSGSEAAFVRLMNSRAAQIGATNTHFMNASGLDDHIWPYSTARDMALIGREAMQNPEFRAVVSTGKYQFNGPRGLWALKSSDDFVLNYPGATGVKNGWTEKANYTLVTSAYRNGTELIVVILGVPNRSQVYAEANRLMDYAFQLEPAAWALHR